MFVRLSKSKVPGKHARGAGKLDPVREHRSQTRGGRGEVTFLRGAFGKPFPEGIPRIQGLSLVKREFVEKGYGASLYEPGFHGSPAKAKKGPPQKTREPWDRRTPVRLTSGTVSGAMYRPFRE